MKFNKNLLENEEAVSVSIGFILNFSVTIVIFSIIILSFYSLVWQAEKTSQKESFEIQGSGHSIRITTIDSIVDLSNSYGWKINNLEYDFSIPASVAGSDYKTNITRNKIVLESDNGAIAYIPLNSTSVFENQEFYSDVQNFKFVYNGTNNKITIEGQ